MASFLDRYLAGEYETVWQELQGLGAAVREDVTYPDAVAVAHETMRRVRTNVELLLPRLSELEYCFGYKDHAGPNGPTRLYRYPGISLRAPSPNCRQRLDDVEAKYGPMPLSLRAFYEVVGSVDLRGCFPGEQPQSGTLDPLQVYALEEAADWAALDREDGEAWEYEAGLRERPRLTALFIGPDPLAKMDYSSVGDMEISMPAPSADAFVYLEIPDEADGMLFVDTLRRAIRHGGFYQHLSPEDPDYYAQDVPEYLQAHRTPDGETYLQFLTRGMVPF